MDYGFVLLFVFVVLPIFWIILLIGYLLDGLYDKEKIIDGYVNEFIEPENKGVILYARKCAYLFVYSPVMHPLSGLFVSVSMILIHLYLL